MFLLNNFLNVRFYHVKPVTQANTMWDTVPALLDASNHHTNACTKYLTPNVKKKDKQSEQTINDKLIYSHELEPCTLMSTPSWDKNWIYLTAKGIFDVAAVKW